MAEQTIVSTISKQKKIKKKKLNIVENEIKSEPTLDLKFDVWNEWSSKSKNVVFKSKIKCVGNGEKKLAKELDISTPLGGQNSTADLHHCQLGKISVKDMTNDDCTLGTEGCQHMRKIFRQIINPFVSWTEKYNSKCKYVNKIYNLLNTSSGTSRLTILEGIDRYELSKSNLCKLNNILDDIKKTKLNKKKYESLKSEYINDICENFKDKTLQELLNECVRKEATDKTLIIVNKQKGWVVIKDVNKITCPRITRGSPRINFCYS